MDTYLIMDLFFCFACKILETSNSYSEFQADRSQWDLLSPYNGKTVMPIFLKLIMNLLSIEKSLFSTLFLFLPLESLLFI